MSISYTPNLMNKEMEFHKIHGAGNDFVVVNNWDNVYSRWEPEFVRKICKYHTGIGADGFLAIEKSKHASFRMRFFNSDGYESEMCVNGSRCICYIAHKLGLVKHEFTFEAGDGVHFANISGDNSVRVQVLWRRGYDFRTFPVDYQLPDKVNFKAFLNTGVPHLVLECPDIDGVDVDHLGAELCSHPYYQPEKTNVNFVQKQDDIHHLSLRVRTFERGVNAETLACGSGATASAISYAHEEPEKDTDVEVNMPGGQLFISILKNIDDIYLEGPVAYIFKGIYSEEAIP